MAIKERGHSRTSQGKLISLRQFPGLPAFESHSENIQIQDQAFERIQETIETRGLCARKQLELQGKHISFGFKGWAAINPSKAPRGSAHCRDQRQDMGTECLPREVDHPGRYTGGHSFQRTPADL